MGCGRFLYRWYRCLLCHVTKRKPLYKKRFLYRLYRFIFWDVGRLSFSKRIGIKPWGLGDFYIADIAGVFEKLQEWNLSCRRDFNIADIASFFAMWPRVNLCFIKDKRTRVFGIAPLNCGSIEILNFFNERNILRQIPLKHNNSTIKPLLATKLH